MFQVVFGHANISSVLKDYSKQNSITLDCVWRIMAEEGNRIYIKIMDYELQRPNMCTVNKIEVSFISICISEIALAVMPSRKK